MRVLAIETSCDETAAAVVESEGTPLRQGFAGQGRQSAVEKGIRVLSSIVASQAELHARTAGVVPEVAARAHVEAVTFVVDDAIRQGVGTPLRPALLEGLGCAGQGRQGAVEMIDAVAVTTEPGLRPALVIGETAARALAVAWDKPLIPVNHLAGHIAAAWLPQQDIGSRTSDVGETWFQHRFPAVALIVSGGHTQLWKLHLRETAIMHDSSSARGPRSGSPFGMALLGQTRDDAAGEAFDKIARLLGLPYPGGAALARLAERGDACEVAFPRPMIDSGDLDFSFSGLKTAVYYAVREMSTEEREMRKADIAASAQEAIVDVLVEKTVAAAAREGVGEVVLTGGVAANARLRERLRTALGSLPLVVPHPQFCTDNAAMIGAAAVLGVATPRLERTGTSR